MIASAAKALFGRAFSGRDYLMLFSLRIDETGTDGLSSAMAIGGAVAPIEGWDALEMAWQSLLSQRGLDAFHLKEFDQRSGPFEGWSDLKCVNFEKRIAKIVAGNTTFRTAIAIDSAAHKDIKQRMRGISGFAPDSDYSLCLRYLMFQTCEHLVQIDPECRLSIIVEDGPWASGAMATYQRVAAMTGKWKPAKHAHRLAGFLSHPKSLIRN